MELSPIDDFIGLMNSYGALGEPFLFIIDFDMKRPEIHKLDSIPDGIKFSTPLFSNISEEERAAKTISLRMHPVPFSTYSESFRHAMSNILIGNSYLLNLTFPTYIETDFTLEEIFNASVAKYRLLYYNDFVVFSPEIFVRISDGVIRSFPMKGTIGSSVTDAEKVILADQKEEAEHNTMVDLIRNDLCRVAEKVAVTRYKYIDRIKSGNAGLLQVSSEISGVLNSGYKNCLGDIITGMLPAGSVTGAPKKETVKIIKESEIYDRGWYTGVFGVFDGKSLDSAVMIRFIEREDEKFIFKSGGGITCMSDPAKEYGELISKIYVPIG